MGEASSLPWTTKFVVNNIVLQHTLDRALFGVWWIFATVFIITFCWSKDALTFRVRFITAYLLITLLVIWFILYLVIGCIAPYIVAISRYPQTPTLYMRGIDMLLMMAMIGTPLLAVIGIWHKLCQQGSR